MSTANEVEIRNELFNRRVSAAITGLGMRIISDEKCLQQTEAPAREHIRKPWMSDSYHRRIQKKWLKRWGYQMVPCIFKTPLGLICHPSLYRQVTDAITPNDPRDAADAFAYGQHRFKMNYGVRPSSHLYQKVKL